jgi:hypothetical protein
VRPIWQRDVGLIGEDVFREGKLPKGDEEVSTPLVVVADS